MLTTGETVPPQERIIVESLEEGVTLKQLVPEDAPELFALIDRNRAHLSQFDDDTAYKYPTEEKVLESIERPVHPRKIRFGIWEDDKLVGSINITPDADGKAAEIGYWVGSEFARRGLAARATRTLADYALQRYSFSRLYASTHKKNTPSRKTLENAGFIGHELSRRAVYQLLRADEATSETDEELFR